jgi:hypothetical protein
MDQMLSEPKHQKLVDLLTSRGRALLENGVENAGGDKHQCLFNGT